MGRILGSKQYSKVFLKNSLQFGNHGPSRYGHFPPNLDHSKCPDFADMFTLNKIAMVNAMDLKINIQVFSSV